MNKSFVLTCKLLLLTSLVGCIYLKGSMESRIYKLYDSTKIDPEDASVLLISDRSTLYLIDGYRITGDILKDLRRTEFHLTPGHRTLSLKTTDINYINNTTTTERRQLQVVLQKGKRYKLRYDLESTYTRYSWIEDAETGEFITGYRKVMKGSTSKPPFATKEWQGSCSQSICSHLYTENRCERIGSCVMIKKSCTQGKGCKATGTFSY